MQSTKSLYAAVIALVLTLCVGAYVDVRNYAMHARQLEINTGLEHMVRLNQELTGMLVVAVLEQNTLRASSYDAVNADLQATLRTVSSLTRQLSLSEEMAVLGEDRLKLHLTEEAALKLMHEDRWAEAHQVLFDETYTLAKKIYEINTDTAVGALTGELAHIDEYFDRLRVITQALCMAAMLWLLWAGAMHARRLQAEVAEQVRLRKEITASNRALEEKAMRRNAELEIANRQLEALSATDGLTGLANRRKFDMEWEIEWQRASRQELPLAIAMLDVDQFKAFNDHYGHQMGDICLRIVAQTLAGAAHRSGELVARYGGEEFVIVMPGLTGPEAHAVMERARAAIQELGLPHAKATVAGVVTISVGVAACVPRVGDHSASLVQAADAAMYQAKHQGRNQVVLSNF